MSDRDVFPADVPRKPEQPDVAAVIHGLVWDYSRTGGWPIVGDDFGFAEWLAARLAEAGVGLNPWPVNENGERLHCPECGGPWFEGYTEEELNG